MKGSSLMYSIDILKALANELDAKWRTFGTFLEVTYPTMEAINKDNGCICSECMVALVGMWLSKVAGTGDLPRTWQMVVEAVKYTGSEQLAQELAKEHGITLPQGK